MPSPSPSPGPPFPAPILLLKTPSNPTDTYHTLLTTPPQSYAPTFLPVLDHTLSAPSLATLSTLITSSSLNPACPTALHTGLIFTSQRAVDAFAHVISSLRTTLSQSTLDDFLPPTTTLYAVGPATARSLRALSLACPVRGEHTGNGDALAAFLLAQHDVQGPRSLLFLVGETRRDVVPRTLMSEALPVERRIRVVELEVYGTTEREAFRDEFGAALGAAMGRGSGVVWVVVFSPQGCRAMLDVLGVLGRDGRVGEGRRVRRVCVATIGPTTRDFLRREFGFEPEVCAPTPSPDGVSEGIEAWTRAHEQHERK